MSDLDNLQKCLASSNDSTLKMTNLLTNFQTRLDGLKDLITPVYLSTNDLKVKHTSKSELPFEKLIIKLIFSKILAKQLLL